MPGIIPIVRLLRSQVGDIDIDQAENGGTENKIKKILDVTGVFVFLKHCR
jgi:hypothetical protein